MAQCRRGGMEFTFWLPATCTKLATWHVHHGKRITSQHRPHMQFTLTGAITTAACRNVCKVASSHAPVSGHVQLRQLCCLWWRQSLLPNSWVRLKTVFQLRSSTFCSSSSRCVSHSTAVSYTTVYDSMSKATICFLYMKDLHMASIDRGNMPDCRTRGNTLALERQNLFLQKCWGYKKQPATALRHVRGEIYKEAVGIQYSERKSDTRHCTQQTDWHSNGVRTEC
jgi:hypothetical protein